MAREMKDSGVEWIGEIPKEWEVARVGTEFREVKRKNIENSYGNALQFKMGEIIPKKIRGDESELTNTFSAYTIVEPGTIMLNGLNLEFDFITQRVAMVKEQGIITSAYIAIQPSKNVSPAYFTYLFKAYDGIKAFHNMGRGLRKILNYNELRNAPIVVPPENEQMRIALFLAKECGEIDAVLEKTRASIEEYKKLKQAVITQAVTKGIRPNRPMKDSGIMWVGAIPTEWHIVKMKYCVALRSGITMGKSYPHDAKLVEMPYLRVANVQGDHVNLDDVATIKVSPEEVERYRLRAGEVLMTEGGDRDKLGRGCIWNGAIDPCLHQNHVFAVTPNQEMLHSQFLDYLTTSDVARLYFDMTAKKTTNLACTNSTTILNFSIPLPSALEQRAICEHLALQCAKIDTLITKKQQFLAELESYKKSLIYEYVTGKKEVL